MLATSHHSATTRPSSLSACSRVFMLRQTTCMTSTDLAVADRTRPVLTTKQAAEYVGLKPHTLQVMKWEAAGPVVSKQGRLNVHYPADLDAWLRERLT